MTMDSCFIIFCFIFVILSFSFNIFPSLMNFKNSIAWLLLAFSVSAASSSGKGGNFLSWESAFRPPFVPGVASGVAAADSPVVSRSQAAPVSVGTAADVDVRATQILKKMLKISGSDACTTGNPPCAEWRPHGSQVQPKSQPTLWTSAFGLGDKLSFNTDGFQVEKSVKESFESIPLDAPTATKNHLSEGQVRRKPQAVPLSLRRDKY